MKAITQPDCDDRFGLVVGEVPDPAPKPGHVIIDVHAAGVNRGDLLQAQGYYPPPRGASKIIGLECSGVIADANGTGWVEGTPVCALLAGGGYAEKVSVPAGHVLPVPDGVTLVEAASVPEVAATVHSNLGMLAGLKPGENILIHGGSGGIGTFATQYAAAMGCTVAVTCGSDEKARRCRELGASITVNYREENFGEKLADFADVILDIMGAKYLAGNIAALAMDGRIVTIGLQGGVKGDLNIGRLLAKRGTLMTSTLRNRPDHDKAAIVASTTEFVWPLLADQTLRPVVDTILPLTQAADAHRLLASGRVTGKIVLTTDNFGA